MTTGSQSIRRVHAVAQRWGDEPRAGLSQLLMVLRPVRKVLGVGVGLGVVIALVGLAQPLAMGWVVNAAFVGGPLRNPLWALVGLFLIDALLMGVQSYVLLRGGESLGMSLRRQMIGRILSWKLPVHEKFRSGDVSLRVGKDVSTLKAVVSDGTVHVCGAVFSLVGAVVLMIYTDSFLFFVSIGVLALSAILMVIFLVWIKAATEDARHEVGVMSVEFERTLSRIRTVITSGMRESERELLNARAHGAFAAGKSAAAWDAMVLSVLRTGTNAAFFVIIGVGGIRVANGSIGIGTFVSFVLYFAILVSPAIVGFAALRNIQRALGALGRIEEIIDEKSTAGPENKGDADTSTYSQRTSNGLDGSRCGVRFAPDHPVSVQIESLHFSYGSDHPPVFVDFSLKLVPGVMNAIIAPSGRGKTTLLSLLLRLYDPDAGEIKYDGVNVRAIAESDLRSSVAYVQQDPPMLGRTLRQNLTYGAIEPLREPEINDVIDRLGLRYLVDGLPDGLDGLIGDKDEALSGGERQRIAVARAVLRQPRLLILDEPTSNIDATAERELLAELIRIKSSCTVLMTSRRQSALEAAGVVFDLAHGAEMSR